VFFLSIFLAYLLVFVLAVFSPSRESDGWAKWRLALLWFRNICLPFYPRVRATDPSGTIITFCAIISKGLTTAFLFCLNPNCYIIHNYFLLAKMHQTQFNHTQIQDRFFNKKVVWKPTNRDTSQ